jgi:hypothetical protein
MSKIWYDVDAERIGHPEATAWIDAEIEKLRVLARNPPPELLSLGDAAVQQWKHRFLIGYGRVLGRLDTLGSFEILPREAVKAIETKLRYMLQGTLGLVAMGLQRVGPSGG